MIARQGCARRLRGTIEAGVALHPTATLTVAAGPRGPQAARRSAGGAAIARGEYVVVSQPADQRIRALAASIPAWHGKPLVVAPLPGGITNTNYRVEVGDTAYVVRIPGARTDLLAIDRDHERVNTQLAARQGLAPRVVHYEPREQVLVLEWLQGDTLSSAARHAHDTPRRLAELLRRLHGGPRFTGDFDMPRRIANWDSIIAAHGWPWPDGYRSHRTQFKRLFDALAGGPQVPCHNDLVPENILDDGTSLRLVDFEYSGNNDPHFELGNLCQELGYDDRQIAALCSAYFGDIEPSTLARVHLHRIVSDVGWSLWAVIQHGVSRLEFDFRQYGSERWQRAQSLLEAADFAERLRAV